MCRPLSCSTGGRGGNKFTPPAARRINVSSAARFMSTPLARKAEKTNLCVDTARRAGTGGWWAGVLRTQQLGHACGRHGNRDVVLWGAGCPSAKVPQTPTHVVDLRMLKKWVSLAHAKPHPGEEPRGRLSGDACTCVYTCMQVQSCECASVGMRRAMVEGTKGPLLGKAQAEQETRRSQEDTR